MGNKKKKNLMDFEIAIGGTGLNQKALLAKYLAVMQKSGLNIVEALQVAIESAQGKMKKILRDIAKSVESGNSLSDAFGRHSKVFSGVFISAIYAGETSGTLSENLENLALQLQKERDLVSKIRGAMIYPIVVLIAAFALGLSMAFLVLPKIIPLFEGLKTDLPATTRGLIWFSKLVETHGTSLFFGIVFGAIFIVWFLRRKFMHPITHWTLLHLPVIKGIVRNSNLARFNRVLGLLLKSGLNINEALKITQDSMTNYHYKNSISHIAERVGKGVKIADNLELYKGLYPTMVVKMVMVGEQSGNLEENLEYLGEFYEAELDVATKNLSTAIEPILLLGIGLVVGFLALSIITPIYNITGNIRR